MEESSIPFPLDVIAIFIDAYVEPYVGTFGSIVIFFMMLGLPIAFLFLAIKKLFVRSRPRNTEKRCAWCHGTKIEFVPDSGQQGEFSWKWRNKDGSPDQRRKDNVKQASYISGFKCKDCLAVTGFAHLAAKHPGPNEAVCQRWLVKSEGEGEGEGEGERKGSDWKSITC